MDSQRDGRTDRWMDRQMDRQMEDHMARWMHGCRWKRGLVAGQIRKISNGWTKHSKRKKVHTTETIKMLARLHTHTYSHPYALKHPKISTHIYRKKYLTTGHTHYHMHKCTCANPCKCLHSQIRLTTFSLPVTAFCLSVTSFFGL